jgi:hypothetical protein
MLAKVVRGAGIFNFGFTIALTQISGKPNSDLNRRVKEFKILVRFCSFD